MNDNESDGGLIDVQFGSFPEENHKEPRLGTVGAYL
jgi:hypothetical protein